MAASDAVVGRRRLSRDDCHILQGEKAMTSSGPSGDAQGYLESLMRAGQDAMKQCFRERPSIPLRERQLFQ